MFYVTVSEMGALTMMNKKLMGNCKSGLLYLEIGIDVFFELANGFDLSIVIYVMVV